MEKTKTKWVLAFSVLAVLLVISIVFGVTSFFCRIDKKGFSTDLSVGQISNVSVRPNETSVFSFSIDDSFLGGQKIPFVLQVTNADLNVDVFLRIKSSAFLGKSVNEINFFTKNGFTLEQDGYYYFNSTLVGGDKVVFCDGFELKQMKDLIEDKMVVTIIVECLDESQDVNSLWKKN